MASVHCTQWLGDAIGGMGKACFGCIIWGDVAMVHAQKFPISMEFVPTDVHGTRWPKGFACNNGLLHSKDLITRVLMVAAAHTPCQGGRNTLVGSASKIEHISARCQQVVWFALKRCILYARGAFQHPLKPMLCDIGGSEI